MDKFKNKDVYVVKYTNRNNEYLYFISKQHDPNSLKSVQIKFQSGTIPEFIQSFKMDSYGLS